MHEEENNQSFFPLKLSENIKISVELLEVDMWSPGQRWSTAEVLVIKTLVCFLYS